MNLAVVGTVCFVLVLAVTPLVARIARRAGVVDRPGPLKVQSVVVPYLGGVAVATGMAVALGVVEPRLLVAPALALVLGTLDDKVELTPRIRLLAEAAIGGVTAVIVRPAGGSLVAMAVLAAGTVVLMNAVNIIDGLDGLAAGVTIASAVGFVFLVPDSKRAIPVGVAAAVAGFAVHNLPPARIYLGDGGAYLIGVVLAELVGLTWTAHHPARALAALLAVAVPLAELGLAVVRRLRARLPVLAGDRNHIYDQLVRRGVPVLLTSAIFATLQGILSVVAWLTAAMASTVEALAIVGAVIVTMLAGAGVGGFLAKEG